MHKLLKVGLTAFGLLALVRLASAAPETASETRSVDTRVVRVQLDGAVDLRIRQGSAGMLVLSGDPRWLARLTVQQSGDTINIGGGGVRGLRLVQDPVRAELVLPRLREVSSEGLGSTEISGFTGDELELALDGAGAMNVNVNYRFIRASLGGVGSMKLAGTQSERIELDLHGAGHVTLAGQAKSLKAELSGLGGLDARQFALENVSLDLSGLGNATVTVNGSANLNLSGLGSVTVYGKPLNRKVSVDGLGKVSWR
ncbi:DUF2807 domain-containing protein [Massilia sp. YIM B02769]|uniref:GIN domain-containing protein n=1 Tax=unclassified Massilia TaxID=2609279 RepID=UPI0025B67DDC|nr:MULTISPECIES: DUF2807 domain-containing protein [unclassified Massilia]MDN4058778.1 DUF2807 domain-containing protein [Massilia sp. YIM B02769]